MLYVYLKDEKTIELIDGKKLIISPSKHEILLEPFKDSEHSAQEFVAEISQNPLLRQFLFLKNVITMSLDNTSKATVNYPFCFEPYTDLATRLTSSDHEFKIKKLEEKINLKINEFGDLINSYYRIIFKIQLHSTALNKAQEGDSFLDIMQKSAESDPKIAEQIQSIFIDSFKSWQHLSELYRFLDHINIVEAAIKNSLSINQTMPLPEKSQQILDALSVLSKHFFIKTISMCIDCYFVYNDYPPFVSTTSSVRNMNLNNGCPRCGKKGLVHRISWDYLESITKLIMPYSSWLYEIIIGNAIANLDFVKDVYIHKKIHFCVNEKRLDPVESDVTIVTKDNSLLLAEVTTQSDDSNITSAISKKCEYMKKTQIPYEKLMYFTSSESSEYRDMETFRARIFGLKHLYKLDDFVNAFVLQKSQN